MHARDVRVGMHVTFRHGSLLWEVTRHDGTHVVVFRTDTNVSRRVRPDRLVEAPEPPTAPATQAEHISGPVVTAGAWDA